MKVLALTLLTLFCSIIAIAQNTQSVKAVNDTYRNGEQALLEQKYKVALKQFERVLKIDPLHTASLRAAGICYDLLGQYEKALVAYLKVLNNDPYFSRIIYYEIGRTYYRLGQYHSALDYFSQFAGLQELSNENFGLSIERERTKEIDYLKDLSQSMIACQVSIDSIQFLNIREIINIGPAINTQADEYFPFIVNDNSLMFYTRRKDVEKDEDLFVSAGDNEIWEAGQSIGSFNSRWNEGMTTFVRNGRKLYFTACERDNILGTCDIWEATADGKKIKDIQSSEGYLNSERWDSQASISCDGNVIYFASNRKGGYGGTDIWRSEKEADGLWSAPENMGPHINSAGDEEAPFITNDGKMLYFSSTGHFGMGEQDIYFSRKTRQGYWSKPRNLGPPVNSAARELGFFLSADGKTGYFASSRTGGYGGMDIYKFKLSTQLMADPITFIEGQVKDKDFGLPVRTTVEIPGRYPIETDERGRFFICFPANEFLSIEVDQRGFLPYKNVFEVPYWENKSFYTIDILLSPKVQAFMGNETTTDTLDQQPPELPKPKKVDLKKVSTLSLYYGTNESDLNNKNRNHLNRFVEALDPEKITKVEIIGYADYVGSDAYNLKLSEERAKSVASFLKNMSILVTKVYLEGKGEINSEENEAQNRRVEIVIHSKM